MKKSYIIAAVIAAVIIIFFLYQRGMIPSSRDKFTAGELAINQGIWNSLPSYYGTSAGKVVQGDDDGNINTSGGGIQPISTIVTLPAQSAAPADLRRGRRVQRWRQRR